MLHNLKVKSASKKINLIAKLYNKLEHIMVSKMHLQKHIDTADRKI